MTPDEFTPWLDIPAAARVLRIPETTLRGYVTAGRVQHTRLGRHVRFTPADLAAIAQDGVQPVTPNAGRSKPRHADSAVSFRQRALRAA